MSLSVLTSLHTATTVAKMLHLSHNLFLSLDRITATTMAAPPPPYEQPQHEQRKRRREWLAIALTTLLVLFALLTLGGESIAPFSIALIVGIIVGTYSSIFVASPVLLFWESKRSGGSTAVANEGGA